MKLPAPPANGTVAATRNLWFNEGATLAAHAAVPEGETWYEQQSRQKRIQRGGDGNLIPARPQAIPSTMQEGLGQARLAHFAPQPTEAPQQAVPPPPPPLNASFQRRRPVVVPPPPPAVAPPPAAEVKANMPRPYIPYTPPPVAPPCDAAGQPIGRYIPDSFKHLALEKATD